MSRYQQEGPTPISELIVRAARAIPKNDLVGLAAIRSRWSELIEAPLRDHCEAVALNEGVLSVAVDPGPWLSGVQLASRGIVEALGALGAGAPSSLRVVRRSP
jgi:hypothetical protein